MPDRNDDSGALLQALVFLVDAIRAVRGAGRASFMRTIKCLKGIRWMPWR